MERYEIRLAAHVDARRARSLGCSRVDGDASLLLFDARDQAGLYGLLARLRDMGAELVGVRRTTTPEAASGAGTEDDPDAR